MSVNVWPEDWPDSARNAVSEWEAMYGEARDALEALVDWENYDAEYSDNATRASREADLEHARAVLAKHPRPFLDTGGKWHTLAIEGIDPDLFGTVCHERDVAQAEVRRLRDALAKIGKEAGSGWDGAVYLGDDYLEDFVARVLDGDASG